MAQAISLLRSQRAYFAQVFETGYFWSSLVRMDMRTRYRGSVIGIGWSLLRPISMTAVICIVFSTVFKLNIREFAPFLMTGLAIWQFFSESLVGGCNSFTQGAVYIKQRPLPLLIFPLRTALGAGFHTLMALGIAILLSMAMLGSTDVTALPFLIPGCVLAFVFACSLATLGAVVNTHFPDTSHLVEIFLQIMFYMTPIIYPPEQLRTARVGAWIVELNPFAQFMQCFRDPILKNQAAPLTTYLSLSVWTLCIAIAALWILRRCERRLVFWL